MTEEGHGGVGMDTLVQVHHQVVLTDAGEDLSEMGLMVLDGGDAHQDIIYITEDKWDIMKPFMNNTLKCTSSLF